MKKVKEYLESIKVQFEAIYWKRNAISHAKRIKDGAYFQALQELALHEIKAKGVLQRVYTSQIITHFQEDYIHAIVKMRIVFLYNYKDTTDETLYTFFESEGPIQINYIESTMAEFVAEGIRLMEIEENAKFINNYKGPTKFNWDA